IRGGSVAESCCAGGPTADRHGWLGVPQMQAQCAATLLLADEQLPKVLPTKRVDAIDVCGFIGGTDPSWSYAAALDSIAHRGPDAAELALDGPIRVGFRRLSIIDLRPAANQPMLAPDGASWIVFNGEIYGYRELRSSLARRG